VGFEDEDVPWREAPARWALVGDVPRRHALAEAWRNALAAELNPVLAKWHEGLRQALPTLTPQEWIPFWAEVRELDLEGSARLSRAVLDQSQDVYGHALGVYLAQVGLPIDDAWQADVDWAFRAARFDTFFVERLRMPTLVRTFGDLGIDLRAQSALLLEQSSRPGVWCGAVDVPREVHVLQRLVGGYQDYLRGLRGIGMASHAIHTDASLPFWQRWLGDAAPTLGYGLLLEGLGRDRAWLVAHLDFVASDDFRIISHLAWLRRVRGSAVDTLYEQQQLWQDDPGGALAADFEVQMSEALRTRHFADEALLAVRDAPWSTLRAATRLRAEVFAAQLRAFLKREYDEEWWRNSRAARFLVQELWRPGRRHSAEELLGFMGYPGFDAGILWTELAEALRTL
jgi:hypothetical protein